MFRHQDAILGESSINKEYNVNNVEPCVTQNSVYHTNLTSTEV